jgi:4-amino-4-deoxy-L-arabinose transferase-like glycosyltransferase
VLATLAALVALRLSSFGILDPWELAAADAARDMATGATPDAFGPPVGRWLTALGFAAFGTTEWAGRLPIALAGLATLAALYLLVAAHAGRRAGAYAAVVLATTPLFLLNARQMLGQAPAFLAETLVGLCAAAAVFGPNLLGAGGKARPWWPTAAWLAAMLAAVVLAVLARGALLGVLPPLAAVAVAAALGGVLTSRDKRRSAAAWAVTGGAIFVAAAVAQAVAVDAADYSFWLGGRPRGGEPPGFGAVLSGAFHAFAPWSALLLVALGQMLVGQGTPADGSAGAREAHLRRVVVLWAAFGYGALTLFLSRYGVATWTAVAPLAAACALFLRDVERSREPWWPAAVVVLLFVVLLIRDFGLYPASPLAALPVEGVAVPDVFNPRVAWGGAFAAFAAVAALCLGARPGATLQDAFAPYRRILDRVRTESTMRRRAMAAAAATALLVLAATLAWWNPSWLPLTVLARKVTMGLALVVFPGLPLAIALFHGALILLGRLEGRRALPIVVAALAVGAYVSHGFLPALSAHYSPRHIYDIYNRLAGPDEPLGEFRVGQRAAAYYARGEVQEIAQQADLLRFLTEGSERRWAVLPADELPAVNRQYRQRTGKHLYVADATSGRAILAATREVSGRPNQNFLAKVVRDEPGKVGHPVGANYDQKIELVGYDLELPHGDHVGAGESIVLRWYWKVLDRVSGSWQVFVHIERGASRLNGDHEPVDGKYPVRLWEKGDVILDEQTLTVPAHFAPGDYHILVGFWAGEKRLTVVDGPRDDVNRVRAGVLRVR